MNDKSRLREKVIGRLAPSPTGSQHLGNARTFLLAWWLARSVGGKLFLRIEDLDTPRIKPWAKGQAIEDLKWLGIDWDDIPQSKDSLNSDSADETYWIQSNRTQRYAEVLDRLKALEAIYPCTCTRSDIEASQSAPHELVSSNLEGPAHLDGVVYPGTCSSRCVRDTEQLDAKQQKYAWRFRFSSQPKHWEDQFAGIQELSNPQQKLGDFVVARSNGSPAYQIAVVVDDHDMGVNQVVRGADLIYSTYRQLAIYELLNWSPPSHYHFPLVVGPDGKRLAKRHGDTRLSLYREQGVAPERVIGFLAYHSGWTDREESMTARDLLSIDLLSRQSSDVLVVNGF
ncbi:MAG: tRNA glutamyl-Q(34) synthetase GluQRS [Planctomycetota bacterium]|nr:tRNA glutamyl-Q(34) synthetase GluQRS [Planctomycetota bacterium]